VPKFKEFATNYARRSLIIGTTNDEEFLPPDTEHRRWLPLHVDIVNTDLIKRDREQLWAEGYACWQRHGIHWRGADTLAAPARQLAAMEDNWAEQIAQWLHDNPADHYRMADIMTNAIGLDHRAATRAHELRVARALHGLGYARRATRVRGRVTKVWMLDPTA
jgi:predicted P-loop ATPase